MIRVLIVDDSLFIRTILRDLLKGDPEIEVVGTAVNGIDALEKIAELNPDVVTLDIEMPRMGGLEVLETLQGQAARPKILVLSTLTSRNADMTHQALRLGADDFMLKPKDIPNVRGIERELVQKIRNLLRLPRVQKQTEIAHKDAETVVVIGSSAGGPPMLDVLLSGLPADLPAAVVITQHMPEGFTASLAERLNGPLGEGDPERRQPAGRCGPGLKSRRPYRHIAACIEHRENPRPDRSFDRPSHPCRPPRRRYDLYLRSARLWPENGLGHPLGYG